MKKTHTFFAILLLSIASIYQSFGQCAIPSGLNATAVNPTTENFAWTAVGGASSYKIEVENANGNNVPYHLETTIGTNSYTLAGLTAGANYKFKVRTNCGGNHSDWSAWFFFNTSGNGGGCNTAPANLTVTNKTSSGAKLNWNSTGSSSYRVRIEDASGNPVNLNFTANTTNTFYNATGLNANSHYKFKVRSICNGNTGPWSPYKFFFTGAALKSGSPVDDLSGMTVYPNPARNEITIDQNSTPLENVTYTIQDMSGREIANGSLENEASQKISVSNLPAGAYVFSVIANGATTTRRINITK